MSVLICAMLLSMSGGGKATPRTLDITAVHLEAPLKAHPFRLSEVKLLAGPFHDAMMRDAKYLLTLDPVRLLHGFYMNAHLPAPEPEYGGWESEQIAGHTLGHYLSAITRMYIDTGNPEFLKRVNYIVSELARCQANRTDGFVGAIPNADHIFGQIQAGIIYGNTENVDGCWVPWYTLHKLFAGLIDAYTYCHSQQALAVATRLADWTQHVTSNLTPAKWQAMLHCEQGGMNESMADLYAITGKKRYLTLADDFYHKALLDPLANGQDPLPGLHSNTQIPKIVGAARLYEVTDDLQKRAIARNFWRLMVYTQTYANGGDGDGEYLGPAGQLAERLSSTTCETCCTYNMVKLSRHLFLWHPSAEIGDYMERALFNHILASQDPANGMMCYYIPMASGDRKVDCTPFNSFWCCVGTGMENHSRYPEWIYFHTGAGLYVDQFIASKVDWRSKGVTVTQTTQFPFKPTTHLSFKCQAPTTLRLLVRRPFWVASSPIVWINGRKATYQVNSDGFMVLNRRWRNGDSVKIDLPMSLRLEPMPNDGSRVAIMDGPILLAAVVNGLKLNYTPDGEVFPLGDLDKPVKRFVRTDGKALDYKLTGGDGGQKFNLEPFFETGSARYAVYWDLYGPAEMRQFNREIALKAEAEKALMARTVDFVQPANRASERAHDLKSSRSGAGYFNRRGWRDAYGGWFSYDLKVGPGPLDLVCTFWGSDSGNRRFQILVDGTVMGSVDLRDDHPGKFFDITYPLPDSLIQGKTQVTLTVKADSGAIAGGLFGVRILRHEETGGAN